eukprot:CAMPEP_0194066170 /NCGR_PEP_ID=MMETSP0009_2-20130614/85876_1 /TAXON_ID=210454 /ORGANISM="Grammatophora oceanica, Strain CCMP 410" /LENGTH=49 /DNA_ID=CAMNT_0038719095 /DNA_START=251 /DNA_END=400 /DNA_ORIENTATION=+
MKLAADTVAYQLGMTDEVKGTGVWMGYKKNREEEEAKKAAEAKKVADKK